MTMAGTVHLDDVVWEENVDEEFRELWTAKLLGLQTEKARGSESASSSLLDSLKSLRSYNYSDHDDASGRSLVGWSVAHNAQVVLRVHNDNGHNWLGWAVRIGDNTLTFAENRSMNIHEEEVQLFVTYETDLLDVRLDELQDFGVFITKTPAIQACINDMSVLRTVVGVLFADFYANVILVAEFINATNIYLREPEKKGGDATYLLYGLAAYFLLREMLQISSQRLQYCFDPWNILDLSRVALLLAAVQVLQSGDPDDRTGVRVLLAAAIFIFAGLISFLRSAFLPFSKFVSGVTKICMELLPFFVISIIVILGFGYMYWVARFECPGFCNLSNGFNSAYAFFVGGPEEIRDLLDIFTGLVLVIVLLNVVIAIVTEAWDSTETSEQDFWIHRLMFLMELKVFLQRFSAMGDNHGSKKQQAAADWIGTDISRRTQDIQFQLKRSSHVGESIKLYMKLIVYGMFYGFLIVVGLVTFGHYWPRSVRKFVFGRNKTVPQTSLQNEMKALKENLQQVQQITRRETSSFGRTEVQSLREEVGEMREEMTAMRQQLESLDEVLSILRNAPIASQVAESDERPRSKRLI